MSEDRIKCQLCSREFGEVNYSHLKSAHNITTDEYLKMFPGVETMSKKTRQGRSESTKGLQNGLGCTWQHSEEAKQKMREAKLGNQYMLGHTFMRSEETRRLLSEALMGNTNALGHVCNEEAIRQMSKVHMGNQYRLGHTASEETRLLLSEAKKGNQYAQGHTCTEESRRQNSESNKELWKDPEYAKWMSEKWNRRPNERELQLRSVLDKHFPSEWKYVGDGQLWIGGRNPDFVNVNSKKQVIEVFGYHWHDPDYFPNRLTEDELIAHYKEYGLDCLVFWEFDVYNEEEVVAAITAKWNLEEAKL